MTRLNKMYEYAVSQGCTLSEYEYLRGLFRSYLKVFRKLNPCQFDPTFRWFIKTTNIDWVPQEYGQRGMMTPEEAKSNLIHFKGCNI